MFNYPFDPVFTRPTTIITLADVLATMYADMTANPAKFGNLSQLKNTYFHVRRTALAIARLLLKPCDQIPLDEIFGIEDALRVQALKDGIDRKHFGFYVTWCKKIIRYAQSCGWSSDALICMDAWEPVAKALTQTKTGAMQVMAFLISIGKSPSQTCEEDLEAWHAYATDKGMLPDTADGVLIRFRNRLRNQGLQSLFPQLNLKSKKHTSYLKKADDIPPSIKAEIDSIKATYGPRIVPDRSAKKALREATLNHTLSCIYRLYGCIDDQLKLGPFESLDEIFTTENLCKAIAWLHEKRDLDCQGIHRLLDPILALSDRFKQMDSEEVRNHLRGVPRERKHELYTRKQRHAFPYEMLKEIPNKIQSKIDAGGLDEYETAVLLRNKAIIAVLAVLLLRQRNIRECELMDSAHGNLIEELINPKMLHEEDIPDCVRFAYEEDESRKFLMFKYREDQTKGKRAQLVVIPLALAAILKEYLAVREFLLDHREDPGTLFFNRFGKAFASHNLRTLVKTISRNYAGKAIPPHVWRDLYSTYYGMLIALSVESDPDKLGRKLWQTARQTTDKYNHIDSAYAGIAYINMKYRASQQSLTKDTTGQFDQPESRLDRAA